MVCLLMLRGKCKTTDDISKIDNVLAVICPLLDACTWKPSRGSGQLSYITLKAPALDELQYTQLFQFQLLLPN
jgi:hypothetical protein